MGAALAASTVAVLLLFALLVMLRMRLAALEDALVAAEEAASRSS
jgi:hypothetical protein